MVNRKKLRIKLNTFIRNFYYLKNLRTDTPKQAQQVKDAASKFSNAGERLTKGTGSKYIWVGNAIK